MRSAAKIVIHLVGVDDLTKEILIKDLNKIIDVIDIGSIQQQVYISDKLTRLKNSWSQLGYEIVTTKKLAKNLGNKYIKKLEKAKDEQKKIGHEIQQMWKTETEKMIKEEILKMSRPILLIGYHVFPKDFRIRLDFNLTNIAEYQNRFIYEMEPAEYVAQQIRYYLRDYGEKIAHGRFPLRFLDTQRLTDKYEKTCAYYERQRYEYLDKDKLFQLIENIITKINDDKNRVFYLPLPYRAGNQIVLTKPTELCQTRDEAINKMKKNSNGPIYLYTIAAEKAVKKGNKETIVGEIIPLEEESLILTTI